MNLDVVTRELGLHPRTSWCSGERRRTPKGDLLEGVRSESYWSHDFQHPDGMLLSDFVESIAKKLKAHEEFLQGLSLSGGSASLFIGWFSGFNSGDHFSWMLLSMLASLRISLSFDIYGESKDENETEVINR